MQLGSLYDWLLVLHVLAFGVWMVVDDDAWTFGQTWVWFGLALLAAAVLVGAMFLSRSALAAERALAAGDHPEAKRQLRQWTWWIRLILLLLAVAGPHRPRPGARPDRWREGRTGRRQAPPPRQALRACSEILQSRAAASGSPQSGPGQLGLGRDGRLVVHR